MDYHQTKWKTCMGQERSHYILVQSVFKNCNIVHSSTFSFIAHRNSWTRNSGMFKGVCADPNKKSRSPGFKCGFIRRRGCNVNLYWCILMFTLYHISNCNIFSCKMWWRNQTKTRWSPVVTDSEYAGPRLPLHFTAVFFREPCCPAYGQTHQSKTVRIHSI